MSSYQGSIASGAAAQAYVATAIRLPGGPPLAYWRLASTNSLLDEMGARNGSWISTGGSLVSGLPQGSDGAVDFKGVATAEVPHDAGLALSAFSLSVWFRLNALPGEGKRALLLSKDQTGNVAGDFFVYAVESGELSVHFQTGTAQPFVSAQVEASTTYHLCVRADSTGFDIYLNGKQLGKNTSYTGAWASNAQPIRFATTPWTADLGDVVLDEVALYDRILAESEVIALSQQSGAPIANNDGFVVSESATTILNVVNNDTFVGQKANLTVEVTFQPTHGTATVRADNNIDFAASAVTQDEADSFTYRITDTNGISNIATVNVTVQNSESEGGGTLVYDWAPKASWIDGVALANRSGATHVCDINKYNSNANSGATVGGNLLQSIRNNNGVLCCWNRAPTGHPSLEVHTPENHPSSSPMDFALQLFNHLDGSPRHLRVVFELKTCKSSDPTTHKSQGLGITSGSYTNWTNTHVSADGTNQGGKYFLGMYFGTNPRGGCSANWWGNSSFPINQGSIRVNWGLSSKNFGPYTYWFGRSSRCGQFTNGGVAKATDTGVHGVWHRLELEVFLTTPDTVPANARRSEPETQPSLSGVDGFTLVYLTKDIDAALGPPGARQLIGTQTGLLFSPRFDDMGSDDNMHLLANLAGPWFNLFYGGGGGSFAAGWAWIRRVQVYRHD